MTEAERLAQWLDHYGAVRTAHEAAALIRSQADEIERKSDAIQRLWKERDDLRAERDALRADAERYRWLRQGDGKPPPDGIDWPLISMHESDEAVWGEEADAAVDAARQS